MDSLVKHKGTTISNYVISYEREHKICTGIGQISIVVSRNIGRTFNPWDSIDIYENGDFKNRYYVSSVKDESPSGTLTIEAQDNSKRLVDYFIPDTYTIDYPSYTRYWIEKFFDEAGIGYVFDTESDGNLISNYTQLGLSPAYEQILTLLQMSGWYMYFNSDGDAVVGELTKELSPVDGSYGKTDILEVVKKKDDKMLRNRALVLGNYDPLAAEQIVADVSRNTPWNYDAIDKRTVVISNSNIPNVSSAYVLANQLLMEFARITTEKHITIAGAKNLHVGDVVKISSKVWSGKGLITSFGTTMSKDGLVTNLVLDERCPRLFGFFNFGDYVYVGTYGDGVWRKHIRFDHTWENFSDGLTDLAITDLHINNGIFSAVGASGLMFYNLDSSTAWSPIITPALESLKLGEEIIEGSGIVLDTFSGLMARATIVDKELGRIVYGLDTFSGLNVGDYFMSYSTFFPSVAMTGILDPSFSGVLMSGEYRGWLIDYDVSDGFGSPSNIYPISVSGNYDVLVVDLENDGKNDYVSIRLGNAGSGTIPNDGVYWSYGYHTTQPYITTIGGNEYPVAPANIPRVEDNTSGFAWFDSSCGYKYALIAYDNQPEESVVVSIRKSNGSTKPKFVGTEIIRTINEDGTTNVSTVQTVSNVTSILTGMNPGPIGLISLGGGSYRVWYYANNGSTAQTIGYQDWNMDTNTLSTAVQQDYKSYLSFSPYSLGSYHNIMVIDNICYILFYFYAAEASDAPTSQTYIRAYLYTIDMAAASVSVGLAMDFELPYDETSATYYIVGNGGPVQSGEDAGFDTYISGTIAPAITLALFQNGTSSVPQVIGRFPAHHHRLWDGWTFPYVCTAKEYVVYGSPGSLTPIEVWSNQTTGEVAERYTYYSTGGVGEWLLQFTRNKAAVTCYCKDSTATTDLFMLFNASDYITFSTPAPANVLYSKIYPILNTGNKYITNDSGTWYISDTADPYSLGSEITPPDGYTLVKPFSSPLTSYSSTVYFICYDDEGYLLVPFSSAGSFNTALQIRITGTFATNSNKGINVGNLFISEPTSYAVTDPKARIQYIDMLEPVDEGGAGFLVLQRDGEEFNVVRVSSLPIRIDISNSSPLLTVTDDENSFISYYINGSGVLEIDKPFDVNGTLTVQDYRYALLISSGELGVAMQGVNTRGYINTFFTPGITASGDLSDPIGTFDLLTMSGSLGVQEVGISGLFNHLETTNFVSPGQYMFVTTAGESPMFYQKDYDTNLFIYYSGLPISRATIIRIDDMV